MSNPWRERRRPRPGAIATGVLAAVLLFDIGADVGRLWLCSSQQPPPPSIQCLPGMGVVQGIAFKVVALVKLLETGSTRPGDAGKTNQPVPPPVFIPRGP